MATLLYVEASPRKERSHSIRVTNAFLKAYEDANPGDDIDRLDLWDTELPRFDGDTRALWRNWITRGWFDWESEGYPFWGNMHHTQTYWNYKSLPNFMFLHYADMLADHAGDGWTAVQTDA